MSVLEVVGAFLFIGSSAILFNEKFGNNKFMRWCAGLLALVSTCYLLKPAAEWAVDMWWKPAVQRPSQPNVAANSDGSHPSTSEGKSPEVTVSTQATRPPTNRASPWPCAGGEKLEGCLPPASDVALEPNSGQWKRKMKSGNVRSGPGTEYPAVDDILPYQPEVAVWVNGRVKNRGWYQVKWTFTRGFLGRWPPYIKKYYLDPEHANVHVSEEIFGE